MKTIRVHLGERSYPIFVSHQSLGKLAEMCTLFGLGPRYVAVSNPTVWSLYGEAIEKRFAAQAMKLPVVEIGDGEEFKTLATVEKVVGEMLDLGCDRETTVVAVGGGVVGDLAGFVASVYMRGVSLVQVPTTLLAQVDASVGGKTAVNHALGKNMIGTFYQPRFVWIDTAVLSTLPRRELFCGTAEVVKYGVIRDAELFARLESDLDQLLALDPVVIQEMVARSCEIKAEIVSADERESSLREVLNFGHTVGHALEAATNYRRFTHGEAVLLGMLAEAVMARELGRLSQEEVDRLAALVQRLDPPADLGELTVDALLERMVIDKKVRDGQVRVVLPTALGSAGAAEEVSEEVLRTGIARMLLGQGA